MMNTNQPEHDKLLILLEQAMYVYYCRTYEKAVSGGEREGKRRTCAKGHH